MKPRQIRAQKRYNDRKDNNLCVKCGESNDNYPMVACKICYNKVLRRRGKLNEPSSRDIS